MIKRGLVRVQTGIEVDGVLKSVLYGTLPV